MTDKLAREKDAVQIGQIGLRRDFLLARNLITGLAIGTANALVLTFCLINYVSAQLGVGWFVVLTITMILRTLIASNVRRLKRRFRTWEMKVTLFLTIVSGSLWGLTPYFIGADSHQTEIVAIFLCAGMTAAASLTFATHMKIVVAFNVPALLIFMSAYANSVRSDNIVILIVLALYLMGTIAIARRVGSTTNDAMENEIIATQQHTEITKTKNALKSQMEEAEKSEIEVQESLALTRRFNETLDQFYRSYVVECKPTQHLIADVSECVSKALNCERVSVWTFSADGAAIICDDLYQASENSHDEGQRLDEVAFPEYFVALRSRRFINASDAENDPVTSRFRDDYLRPLNIKSMLDAPIRSAHGVRGVICCEAVGTPRNWTIDEIAFVSSVAQFITMRLLTDSADNLANELTDALSSARAANDAKLMFLATMSHEIRTPMNGVLGAAAILKKQSLDANAKKFVSVIDKCGTNLMSILNDILDFSKIESGKVELEHAPFRLSSLFASIESVYTLKAEEKGLRFEVRLENGVEDTRVGDQHRTVQLLHNLLSNAFKFTKKGSVTVTIDNGSTLDGEGDFILIEVSDTGIGISDERLPHVFDSFVQADSSTTRQYGGSGLGLSIVKGIVDAMGGEITVRSQLGAGATFSLTIPLRIANDSEIGQPEREGICSTDIDAISILVADDNSTNRLITKAYLQKSGSVVTFAINGREAVDAFQKDNFDIVLMDIHMPEMDGVEALSCIRQYEIKNNRIATPIIAVTADAMQHQVQEYLKLGFSDHVAKPVIENLLLQAISRNLPNNNEARQSKVA